MVDPGIIKIDTNHSISNITPQINPLYRVFVPKEFDVVGHDKLKYFRTSDMEVYIRDSTTGVIRHATKKVRGKAARRHDKKVRRINHVISQVK